MTQRTALHASLIVSVTRHSYSYLGGSSCDIYLWVDSLDKQIQNEKELIHLASAGGGGYFVFVWRVLT